MGLKINLSANLLSGLLFAMLGAASMVLAFRYQIGTAARMGPGYFPMLVGGILVVLGSCLVGVSFVRRDEPLGRIGLRPLACILLGIVVFGVLIESGLITATIAAIVIASFARPIKSLAEVLLVATGLALFAALVFVFGLNLPMRLLPF